MAQSSLEVYQQVSLTCLCSQLLHQKSILGLLLLANTSKEDNRPGSYEKKRLQRVELQRKEEWQAVHKTGQKKYTIKSLLAMVPFIHI